MSLAAGIDLGFARDSSALVTAERVGDRVLVRDVIEVRGGDATDPRSVVRAFAETLHAREIESVTADVHYRELLRVELADVDIGLVDAPAGHEGRAATYLHARRLMIDSRLSLPRHQRLLAQLYEVRGRPLAAGGMSVEHGRADGAHGDLVDALVLALWQLRERPAEWDPRGVPARSVGWDPRHAPERAGVLRDLPELD